MVNGNMIPVSMLEEYTKNRLKGGDNNGQAK
jgi:hypothetical protein